MFYFSKIINSKSNCTFFTLHIDGTPYVFYNTFFFNYLGIRNS